MKFYCLNCKQIVDEDENCCSNPHLVETKYCKICDKYYYDKDREVVNDICEYCLQEQANFNNALKYGEEQTQHLNINGFIASLLSEETINKTLVDYIKLNKLTRDELLAEQFCLEDKWDFAEFLKKGDFEDLKEKQNENI